MEDTLNELIQTFHPDYIFVDGGTADTYGHKKSYVIQDAFRRIVANFYNSSEGWGGEPVITFKRESLYKEEAVPDYEGGLREPSIAWWPGKIAAGSVCDVMMSEMDILPTLVRLAGGEVPPDRKIDGLNVWPVLSGQTKMSPHEALYYWLWGSLQAVRSGPWKLVIADQKDSGVEGGGSEGAGTGKKKGEANKDKEAVPASIESPRLYNLDQDIGETTDVAAKNPEVVKRLQELITKMDTDLGIEKSNKKQPKPGIRPAGNADNPQPLLMRTAAEYD